MDLGDEVSMLLMRSLRKRFQKEIIHRLNQLHSTQKLLKTSMWLWAQLLVQTLLQNQVDLLNLLIKHEQWKIMKETLILNLKLTELTLENLIKISFSSTQIYGTKNQKLSPSLTCKIESLKFVARDQEMVFVV